MKSKLTDEQWAELKRQNPVFYEAMKRVEEAVELMKKGSVPDFSPLVTSREGIKQMADVIEAIKQQHPAKITDRDRELAKDLFLAFECKETFFRAKLYRLLLKADAEASYKMKKAFPDECRLLQEWGSASDPRDFYRKYEVVGILRGKEKDLCERICGEDNE